MDPAVEPWVTLWSYLDGNFWHVWRWASARVEPDDVGWQPIPQVASVGWNLQHLAEMLDYYLSQVFGRPGPVQAGPLVTMQSGRLDDGRFRDLQAIGAYHRRVRPAYRTFLAGLTAADLRRTVERPGRQPMTYAWAIGHIAEHESYHLGKCMLLRSLLAARPAPGPPRPDVSGGPGS